jgi:signal transduction histidine kinase
MKSELLEIAAGDLRDPLNSIQQFSDLLLEDKVQPQMKSQFLKLIRDSAYRMSTIITDILDANAVETGSLKINLRPIGLKKLIELTALKYQMELSSNSQMLDIDARTEGVVKGDEDRLKEIIQNLLSNAMKFSPPNTLIRIRLYEENGAIRMEFHDEGQGLTEEDLERLFMKFQKLTPKPSDGGRSIGIGLSIVKRLVEMQNGKISAQSKGKKQGSSFIVEFPKYHSTQS